MLVHLRLMTAGASAPTNSEPCPAGAAARAGDSASSRSRHASAQRQAVSAACFRPGIRLQPPSWGRVSSGAGARRVCGGGCDGGHARCAPTSEEQWPPQHAAGCPATCFPQSLCSPPGGCVVARPELQLSGPGPTLLAEQVGETQGHPPPGRPATDTDSPAPA
jgi:hypothetical protein